MDSGDVKAAARQVEEHPLLQLGARLGYAVSGVVHLLIAWLAVQLATGTRTATADQSGAFATIARTGGGFVVLWVGVAGFGLLGLWQLTETVIRSDPKQRVKSLAKGAVYLVLAWSCLQFIQGAGVDSTAQSVDFTANVMAWPLGRAVVAVVGFAVLGVAAYHVVKGVRRTFLRDLREPPQDWVVAVGRFGYVAKGVAFTVVGCLFLLAAWHTNPAEASGLDGALRSLAGLPLGTLVLLVVALGFAAYAIYSFARSRYARV